MTQSSYITHSLTNRRPYVYGAHYQSRGPMQTFRSQSPFAYPTRLRRPGYRPSSPALSLNRSVPSSDPDRGQTSRTASPASMHTMNRIPTPWQQVVNRSDPMLRYYPPIHRASYSRGSTPKPSPSLHSGASSARLSQAQVMYPGAWPDSPALTPPPLFYDYSEAFEEQTHIHRTSVLVVTPSLPSPKDDQNEYFEHSEIPELEHRIKVSLEGPSTPVTDSNSLGCGDRLSRSEAKYGPEQLDSNAKPKDQSTATPHPSTFTLELPKSFLTELVNVKKPENTEDNQANPGSSGATQQNTPGKAGNQINPSRVQKNEKSIGDQRRPEHDSSSPAASMYSVQSSVPLENIDDSTVPTSGADTATASPEGPPRTPTCESPPFEFSHRLTHGQISEASKASASVKSLRNEYPEIVAPTPERSITSLSNRDRFSKILGFDEALLQSDGLTALSSRRANNVGYAASPIPQTRPRPQESLSTPSTTDHNIAEESDSDDEHELTNGLMETFGRPSGSPTKDRFTKSSPSLPSLAVHDSPIPCALRKSPGIETLTPLNVRLSHRKTVINGGQRLKTKAAAVCHPSTIAEEKAPETAQAVCQTETKSTDFNKDLLAILEPSPSIKAFTPLGDAGKSNLPFAFTPLIRTQSENDSLAELEATTSFYNRKHDSLSDRGQSPLSDSMPCVDRISTASPPSSRPWNLDASYPWDDEEPPKLDVVLPLPQRESQQSIEKQPKFRLRIHRASSSNASKLTKKHRSSEDTISSVIASSVDLLKSTSLRRRPKPNLSITASQSNSSHDIIRASPMQTRFVESFEQPSPTSPVITLLPPSPGHDVRSFFSDDSSQARPKGSLRKRLSEFRARNSRVNSVDHDPGYDRGLLNSAFGLSRASGRSSRQSQTTAGVRSHVSRTRGLRWNFFEKIRAWFIRRDDKIRDWKRKSRYKSRTNYDTSTPLHANV